MKHPERGMAIIITVLLTGIMLSVVFALSAIFIPKIRTASDIKNSVTALYAAESALEWCLYENQVGPIPSPVMGTGIGYLVTDCAISPVQAVGTYRGVTRAFELSF